MRYRFDEIFTENPDESLTPRRTIRVGGATFGSGITFKKGVVFAGVDFFQIKGQDIDAEEVGEVLEIKGYYPSV